MAVNAKVKMQNLGQSIQEPKPMAVTSKQPKKRTEYPTVQINSKQMEGLEKLTKDSNVALMLKAKVKAIREPDNYDCDRLGLSPEDCIVEFKLLAGSVEVMPELKKPGPNDEDE